MSLWRAQPGLAATVFFVLALIAGCAPSEPAAFRLNLEGRDAAKIRPAQREELTSKLTALFGTPDEPRLPDGVALDLDRLKQAAGPMGGDEHGRRWGLFRQHCVVCHGLGGDGAGPSAALLDPYPRDFRNGVFKFTSTQDGAKPVRDDLRRTLQQGLPGTAMPSFAKLPEEEREALIEYVQYLSHRGETELLLAQQVIDADDYPIDLTAAIDDYVLPAMQTWAAAPAQRVAPPPEPDISAPEARAASIARGREIFLSKGAQCSLCHGLEGRGDGEQSNDLYDLWNRPKKGNTPEQTRQRAALFLLPIEQIHPRNFTTGVFHGGDRPTDIYDRIDVGIKGTPMPPAGPGPGSAGVVPPEEIWHLVHFVQSLGPDKPKP